MGTTHSLNYAPISDPILGKKFKTKGCVSFGYCGCDCEYVIKIWKEKQITTTPKDGSFDLQILAPIEFVVTDVENFCDSNRVVKGKIINDIPVEEIGHVREVINTIWTDTTLRRLKTKHVPFIFPKGIAKGMGSGDFLRTSGKEVVIRCKLLPQTNSCLGVDNDMSDYNKHPL